MSPAFRESLKIVVPLLVAWFVSLLLPSPWAWLLGLPLFLLILFTLYFFRDPERVITEDLREIVSAADGTVVGVDEVEAAPLHGKRMKRVSVFLSVFNVHVNRFPYDGTVRQITHTPGEFLDVRLPEASLRNEHQDWLVETARGVLVVRQIAGLVARRIVAWAQEGASLKRGERMGMIRFGSRTEVYLPLECEILVKPGDVVEGGASVIARWSA